MIPVPLGSIADDLDRIDPRTAHLSHDWSAGPVRTKTRRRHMEEQDDVDDLVVTRSPQSPHAFRAEPVHDLLITTDDPELQKMCGHIQDRRVCMLFEADHARWASAPTSPAMPETPASRPAPTSPQPEPAAVPEDRALILGHALQRIMALTEDGADGSLLDEGMGPDGWFVGTQVREIAEQALDAASRLP